MLVKLLVSRAGDGFAQSPGEVIEVGDDEGRRLIDAQQAVETAAADTPTVSRPAVAEEASDKSAPQAAASSDGPKAARKAKPVEKR